MKARNIIGITALCLLLASCDAWGHGLFTKVEVTDIQYIGIWTSNGNYFAAFDYQVKNTGLVDVEYGYITVKVKSSDGSTATGDLLFEYLGVGESASGSGNIQIEQPDVADWDVVDVKRYAPVGTIGG